MKSTSYIAIALLLLKCISIGYAFHATSTPPLLDVPVFSLSTCGDESPNSKSTMNILTYASPISIKPHRMWSISLYKGTMSHENFSREKKGVLQMLRPEHAHCTGKMEEAATGELIRVLGGSSGRDVDKREVCTELGYAWEKLPEGEEGGAEWPHVLPSCVYYLKLELVGDLIDCGSHDVALCKVVSMTSDEEIENAADELDSLSTRKLRDMSIISELGRIKDQ
ncbi:hypothetical protein ACHAXR_005699 [Thalassiosira sp. AJA248-18]